MIRKWHFVSWCYLKSSYDATVEKSFWKSNVAGLGELHPHIRATTRREICCSNPEMKAFSNPERKNLEKLDVCPWSLKRLNFPVIQNVWNVPGFSNVSKIPNLWDKLLQKEKAKSVEEGVPKWPLTQHVFQSIFTSRYIYEDLNYRPATLYNGPGKNDEGCSATQNRGQSRPKYGPVKNGLNIGKNG